MSRSPVVTDDVLRDYEHLQSQGYTREQAAARLGIQLATITRALCRRAQAFDPEAIARRVAERERAERTPAQPRGPLSRIDGSCVTGTGHATHVPLPVVDHSQHDPFAALEAARERNRIRSPFADLPPLTPTTRTAAAQLKDDVDAERFVAPDIDDEEDPVVDEPVELPTVAEPLADIPVPIPQPAAHDPRCGQPLTGGGAPRGWVLMRIVGAGAPRRWCSPACAREALDPERHPLVTVAALRESRNTRRTTIDAADVIRRYRNGQTVPEIRAALGHDIKALRQIINAAAASGQIVKRDDRAGHSGGKPKDYDPQLVDRVRRLYTVHGLTQAQVAEQIGTTTKVVQKLMARHGIQPRPAANTPNHPHGSVDRAAGLKQKMRDHGITAADVRVWARQQQLPVTAVGLVSAALVDAYLAAHPTSHQEATA